MKRLLIVITGLVYGGAETQLVRVSSRLRQRGWSIEIVSMLPPAAYIEELHQSGIPVHNLRMRRKIPDPRALLRLAAIIRRMRPAIVHAHMVHANILARVCRTISPSPVLICSAHSITEGGRIREWAYRITDPLCDLTTQVCRTGAQRYIHRRLVPPHKMLYIPNGVETQRFAPLPTLREQIRAELGIGEDFVWLTVGRIEPPKDYPNLLQSFARLVRQSETPVRLLIVGDGTLRGTVEKQVRHLELSEQVRMLGIRTDIPVVMNGADAFVLASAWEGMPNVLLEAASTALPIVATDVGDNREVVLHNRTGLLVPPRNPEALAEAMLQLMQMPTEHRRAMGLAGRAHVMTNFDIEQIIDRWEQLYNQLLEQKGFTACPQ